MSTPEEEKDRPSDEEFECCDVLPLAVENNQLTYDRSRPTGEVPLFQKIPVGSPDTRFTLLPNPLFPTQLYSRHLIPPHLDKIISKYYHELLTGYEKETATRYWEHCDPTYGKDAFVLFCNDFCDMESMFADMGADNASKWYKKFTQYTANAYLRISLADIHERKAHDLLLACLSLIHLLEPKSGTTTRITAEPSSISRYISQSQELQWVLLESVPAKYPKLFGSLYERWIKFPKTRQTILILCASDPKMREIMRQTAHPDENMKNEAVFLCQSDDQSVDKETQKHELRQKTQSWLKDLADSRNAFLQTLKEASFKLQLDWSSKKQTKQYLQKLQQIVTVFQQLLEKKCELNFTVYNNNMRRMWPCYEKLLHMWNIDHIWTPHPAASLFTHTEQVKYHVTQMQTGRFFETTWERIEAETRQSLKKAREANEKKRVELLQKSLEQEAPDLAGEVAMWRRDIADKWRRNFSLREALIYTLVADENFYYRFREVMQPKLQTWTNFFYTFAEGVTHEDRMDLTGCAPICVTCKKMVGSC